MKKRHTITLDLEAFKKLKTFGCFGESYTELILRLLDKIDKIDYKGGKKLE